MPSVTSPYFFIALNSSPSTISITLTLPGDEMTTQHMPYVGNILKKELPTILKSKCFNENNIPFYKEVLSTELGHLFEHILLEYLCIAKINTGFQEAIFSGMTRWDWNKDPYGTFRIEISLTEEDKVFLSTALNKAMMLFEKILLYPAASQIPTQNVPSTAPALLAE